MIEFIASPLNQLYIFAAIMLLLTVVRWIDSELVILGGAWTMIGWILIAGVFGIRASVRWDYYLYLGAALAAGYAFYILLAVIADKWGSSYNGEGFMAVLIPVMMSLFILVPVMIIKLIWQLI